MALTQRSPAAAQSLAAAIETRHPGAAVILYGSGASVLAGADPGSLLYDFYVIEPVYAARARSHRLLNRLLPPNVYYIEAEGGRLRAKYAVLSIAHLERLVSKRTFHSYFWARFAQPCRIVAAPDALSARILACVETAIDVFVARSAPLVGAEAGVRALWRAGLSRSYRAELRAEQPDRVERLLAAYGDWPERVTLPFEEPSAGKARAETAWRVRSVQGAILSAARLLKATITFEGGVDYIAWKIGRHAGFELPVREWERRWPFFAAPILAERYYRLRRRARRAA